MMSLLLIMENIDNRNLRMDEVIKVSKNAASMGGSQIFLQENEEMTVEDLLKGITAYITHVELTFYIGNVILKKIFLERWYPLFFAFLTSSVISGKEKSY